VGGTRGVVRDGVGMKTDGSALVGSVATMIQLVRNMVKLVGVSLVDAVRMASLNPPRTLGLGGHKGSLEPQRDADIVVFSPSFVVEKTIIGGRIEYERAAAPQ